MIMADDVGIWNISAYHRGMIGGECNPIARAGEARQARSTPAAFAMCVAMASISGGDRQWSGSSLSSLNLSRTAPVSAGFAPDSMMDDTKAANSGGAQPASFDRSVWTSRVRTTDVLCFRCGRRCARRTPCRRAFESSPWDRPPPACRVGRDAQVITRHDGNLREQRSFRLPAFVQPHTWLCATWPLIVTSTLFSAQSQDSVPPAKPAAAGFTPPSTAGCILTLLMVVSSSWLGLGQSE